MCLGHLHLAEHYSAMVPARSAVMGGGLHPSQPGAVACVADTDRGQAELRCLALLHYDHGKWADLDPCPCLLLTICILLAKRPDISAPVFLSVHYQKDL